jgi:hypothetical protein
MTRGGMPVIYPAKTLWPGTPALASHTLYAAAHNQNKGHPRRSRWVKRAEYRPFGSHGSTSNDDLASPCSDASPKSP